MDDLEVKFGLLSHQEYAVESIEKIYSRDNHNRFASVVLPTGGGKSFVAIQQLITFNNPGFHSRQRNGEINPNQMVYIAPRKEILSQVKRHIVKHVILNIPNLESMSIDEIDNMMRTTFPSLNFPGVNARVSEIERIGDNASAKEKKNAILRNITSDQIDEMVKIAFPNLEFICYAGMDSKRQEVKAQASIKTASFIVADEAHRLGAEKWGPTFEEAISQNTNAKVLAITATPERTDNTGRNIMAGLAKMIYPEETIVPDEYVASEIYVLDAVKDGIVIPPEITQGNFTLAESEQYETILRMFKKERKPEKKEKLGKILDEMEEIIGYSPRKLTAAQNRKKKEELRKKVITKSIRNPNGRYIAFIPSNKTKNGEEKPENADYFKEYIKSIRQQFSDVRDENGDPVKVKFYFVTSHTDVKVDSQGNPTNSESGKPVKNSEMIKQFEDSSNESGGIKILISVDMLNEGIHVEGIDGAIMYRKADKETVFLQQMGRCISSTDPKLPLDKQTRPQLIDLAGNTMDHIVRGTGQKVSHRYNLQRIKEIQEWIIEHNTIPNINRSVDEGIDNYLQEEADAEREARLAISIKRLRMKYLPYFRGKEIPIDEEETIREIIGIADNIDLWNIHIPQREIEPSVEELSGNDFLGLTDDQERFMELYNEGNKVAGINYSKDRIHKLLNILKILRLHKSDLELPTGIMIKTNSTVMPEVYSKDMIEQGTIDHPVALDMILINNFSSEEIKEILVELQDNDLMEAFNKRQIYHPGEVYDLSTELAFVRGKVWTSHYDMEKTGNTPFADYSLKDLMELGVIQDGQKDIEQLLDMNKRFVARTNIAGRTRGIKRRTNRIIFI